MEATRRVPLDFYTILSVRLLLAYTRCLDLPSMIRARNAGYQVRICLRQMEPRVIRNEQYQQASLA